SAPCLHPQSPRPCEDYWDEWKRCRGLRYAFHHYYAHGERPQCAQWREDYGACRAWESGGDAAAKVPACEERGDRWAKYAPVWTLRKSPPPDWYLPLDQNQPE
ncbi:CV039 protein, partial [Crypturellus undulatus]|nr:CV039 protein [Crypturellus undulatus]